MIDLQNIEEVFLKHEFRVGRLIGWSKSKYIDTHPDNIVVFNANIVTKEHGKVWYGDLDITLDESQLKKISKELKQQLYILREQDARFGNENLSTEELIKKAIYVIRG